MGAHTGRSSSAGKEVMYSEAFVKLLAIANETKVSLNGVSVPLDRTKDRPRSATRSISWLLTLIRHYDSSRESQELKERVLTLFTELDPKEWIAIHHDIKSGLPTVGNVSTIRHSEEWLRQLETLYAFR